MPTRNYDSLEPSGPYRPDDSMVVSLDNADAAGNDDLKRMASTHFENPVVAERFIAGSDGTVYGRVVSTNMATSACECWHCGKSTMPETLYQPCRCGTYIHRGCFRQWRAGWINPRNYFQCPNCLYSYNIERVKPATTESKERIVQRYRCAVLQVWLVTLLVLAFFVDFFAVISYYADTSDKNVPVGMKYMLSSVINGFPDSNSTDVWRAEFKLPQYHVWPYYTLLGVLCTSILILTAFMFVGCTFDEDERKRKGGCNCCNDCCNGINYGGCYCYDPCPHCDCSRCYCGGGGGCNFSGGGGGNLGEAAIILVLVIVVVVIFSAIFVVIMFCIQKVTLLYDRVSDMLQNQQWELEGETVVLGIHESWRPNDRV